MFETVIKNIAFCVLQIYSSLLDTFPVRLNYIEFSTTEWSVYHLNYF